MEARSVKLGIRLPPVTQSISAWAFCCTSGNMTMAIIKADSAEDDYGRS